MSYSLTDTHCHLLMLNEHFDSVDTVVNNATDENVNRLVNISVQATEWPKIEKISEYYKNIFHSIGIHPCYVEEQDFPPLETIERFLTHPKTIAIGECGLDYYWKPKDEIGKLQADFFLKQINLCNKFRMPIIIHNREATLDIVEILQKNYDLSLSGIFHCFVDDWEIAKKILDMGFYLSFSGIVTFANAKNLQEVAKKSPLDRIFFETDSPFLAPVPHRGKTNQPAYTSKIFEFVAQLRQDKKQKLAEAVEENFFRLFSKAKDFVC